MHTSRLEHLSSRTGQHEDDLAIILDPFAVDVIGTKTRVGLCQSTEDGIHLIQEQNFPSHTADLPKKGWARRLDYFLFGAPSSAEMILLITAGISLPVERIYIRVLIT